MPCTGDGDGKPDPYGATRVFVANLVDTILVSTDINVGSPPVQPHPQPAEEGVLFTLMWSYNQAILMIYIFYYLSTLILEYIGPAAY